MPLVEAQCKNAGAYEALVLRRDQAVCPTCGKEGKTVFNAPATYRMDFRSGWSPEQVSTLTLKVNVKRG